ncbi:MAG TPA: HAD family hydrolase [Micavibrio sp.]
MSRPDAIFFDWDGTLVDTLPGLLIAHNHVRAQFGMPLWTTEQFHHEMKFSSRELYPVIYGDSAAEAIQILRDYMDKNIIKHLHPLRNAEVTLRRLHKAGIATGIVSNKRQEFLDREIAHLGWSRYLSVEAGSGFAVRDKPAGDPIRKALAAINLKPEDSLVWFVGDTATDMLAAADAACLPVLLLHGESRAEIIENHSPAYVFNDCQELLTALEL